MTLYDKARQTALRLIRKNGTQLTLTRAGIAGGATLDPVTGVMSPPATPVSSVTTGPIDAVILPYNKGQMLEDVGGGVKADDASSKYLVSGKVRKLLVAAATTPFVPKQGDLVTGLEDTTWTVIGSNPLAPDGVPIIFTLAIGAD